MHVNVKADNVSIINYHHMHTHILSIIHSFYLFIVFERRSLSIKLGKSGRRIIILIIAYHQAAVSYLSRTEE